MSKKKVFKKVLKLTFYSLLVVFVLAGATAVWLYFSGPSNVRDTLAARFGYPAALVNYRPILMSDFEQRYRVSQKLFSGQPTLEIKKQILGQMVLDEQTSQLAKKLGVTVTPEELDKEYAAIKNQNDGGSNLDSAMSLYGLNEAAFKQKVLRPQLLAKNLNIWFNGQKSLNSPEYATIDKLLAEISQGTSFEDLVKDYTQYDSGRLTQGDVGYVDISQTLPEFSSALSLALPGQTKVVASRYGIHLFKVVDADHNGAGGGLRLHLRQIFLKPENFNAWFATQTANDFILQTIKI